MSLQVKLEGLIVHFMNVFWEKNLKDMVGIPKKSLFALEIEKVLMNSPNRIPGLSPALKEEYKGNSLKRKTKKIDESFCPFK